MTRDSDHTTEHEARETAERVRSLYTRQFQEQARNYAYQWHARNPVSQYYLAERNDMVARLFNRWNIHLDDSLILDVGCGTGHVQRMFIDWGARPELLYGVDLVHERLALAHARNPLMRFAEGSATALPYAAESFDMVTQWTMFATLFDAELRRHAAAEIDRVLRPGGWFVWFELLENTQNDTIRGLAVREVIDLFPGLRPLAAIPLHHRHIGRFVARRPLLARLLSAVPWLARTNVLMLFSKPVRQDGAE